MHTLVLSKIAEAAPSVLQARAAVLRRSTSQTNDHRYTSQHVAPFWSSLWTPASEDHHSLIPRFDLSQSIRHQLATSTDQKAAHQDEEDPAAYNTTPVQAMGSCSGVLRLKGDKATSPALVHLCSMGRSSVDRHGSLLLQLELQTQNSSGKRQRNAAVLQWHKDTQEQARLAR